MNKSEKIIISYLEKRYKTKINLDSKIINEFDIDSFEFVKIISDLEKKIKKKYDPLLIENFSNLTIKKFLKLFR